MNTFKVYYWRPIDRRTLRLRRSCQKPIGTPLVSIGQHNVQVVILETSHNTICVRIDLDGSLKAPSFVCSENNQKNLVGSQSDEALTAGQDLIISSRSRIGYRQRRCGESLFFSRVRPFLMRSSTRKHDLFIILDLRSYPRSPQHPSGISCPTIHLPWFAQLFLRIHLSDALRTFQRFRVFHP